MTLIKDLSQSASLADDDIIPIWSESQEDTRGVSVATLKASVPTFTTNWQFDEFTGNGTTTSFTLARSLLGAAYATVIYNGAVLTPERDYTITGATLTLPYAPVTPSDGTPNLVVRYGREASGTTSDAANTVYAPGYAGAVDRSVKDKLTEQVSVFDFMTEAERYDVQQFNLTLDVAAKIQSAIDYAYSKGGGVVLLPLGAYLVGTTIEVPQRVTLVGESSAFANQYIDNAAAPKGSTIYAKAGLNADVVRVQCRLIVQGGVLVETTLGDRNSDARHFGGLRNLIVWGNRSRTAAYTARDLNSAGHGIHVRGARYVELERVTSMFCAQDGLRTGELDYGLGLIGVNNAEFSRVSVLSNYENGATLSIADARITDINAGNNRLTGITTTMASTTITAGAAWNNGTTGVYCGSTATSGLSVINGMVAYDNDEVGFYLDGNGAGTRVPVLSGCIARGNGRDTGAAPTARVNFFVDSGTENFSLQGCTASAWDQDNVAVSSYGFYVNNTTFRGQLDGRADGSLTANFFIASGNNLDAHANSTAQVSHPGMLLTGDTNVNAKSLQNVAQATWAGWADVTSIASTTIPITTANSLYALNCTGPQTVNDLSFSGNGLPFVIIRNISADAVTFVHNTAKLRLANATNVVLSQHEAIMFVHISGAIWQQVGGAA